MIGVILCGGLGTRLRSVVADVPKAMASVNGRPFLEYQVQMLRRADIREIVLCVGYRWEAIQAHFGDGDRFGVQLTYSVEEVPLGTAGCLKHAEPLIHDVAMVMNGDTYLSLDPSDMLEFHRTRHAAITIAVAPVAATAEYGSVSLDSDRRILSFEEKRSGSGYVNAGAYMIEPAMLSHLTPAVKTSMEYEFLPQLLRLGHPLYGFEIARNFHDIGTPERYQRAQKGW